MEQDRKFSVVVGDFGEHDYSLPPFFGSFFSLKDAREKLKEIRNKRTDFDEDRAYIYETRDVLNLRNGDLSRMFLVNWLRENWIKVLIFIVFCFGVFWFGFRPQIIRSQCAKQNSLAIYSGRESGYNACLKHHGLSN